MARFRLSLLVGLCAALGASLAHAQTSIVLRPTAAIAPSCPASDAAPRAITLADIADLDPPTTPEAAKLGEITITPAPAGPATDVTIAQVRTALDAAKVNWGRITLRGSICKVSLSTAAAASPKTKPSLHPSLTQTTPQPVDIDGPLTLRSAVSGRLVELYNVDPQDLRLAYDPADDDFLSQTIADRRVDVQPTGNGNSARTPVNIYIYEGDRLATTRLVSVQALINRVVITARAPIPRGQAISSDLVEASRQWVGPNTKPSVAPDAVIGQIASRAINAGAALSSADITPPIVCKRGDIVWVHVLSGPLTVKAKCRAMSQARDGELVQLKLDASDRTFSARMSGPGRAVMIPDGSAPDAALNDAPNPAIDVFADDAPKPKASASHIRPTKPGR